MPEPLNAAVFASGGGTDLQALLDHQAAQTRHDERSASRARPCWRIVLVVSDRADAGALERARGAGVATRVIPTKGRSPDDVAADTLAALEEHGVGVIFLAGYLKLVPSRVVSAYRRRILNIHPALLPSFGGKGMYGMNVHRAVIESGMRLSGPTVHFVDEDYDRGTIVAQWPVPVLPGDTPEALAARVLEVEHLLYPRAADHVCRALLEGREPGPMTLPGEAFVLAADAGGTGLGAPGEAADDPTSAVPDADHPES
ncbi:MAG: phosphoribosylglycinamide formyltransferase [Gemmatimonadetes bacterium]|nr:phosphoribosylglycinamide formyltransferase [Gemmatimonadota bacterium]